MELQQATSKMVANLFAKESEKRRQSASEKLENNLRKHYSNTVSASGLRREEAITVTHSVDSF